MLILILHIEAWESGGEVQLLRFLGQVAPFLQDENYMFVQKQKQKLPLWFIWVSQVALVVKNLPINAGDKRDTGLILRLERSPGGGHGDPLQYSCLDDSCGQRNQVGYSPQGLLLLLLSCFSHVRLRATPQTAAYQAPPSLGFSRQEQWSGLPFPSPRHESEK